MKVSPLLMATAVSIGAVTISAPAYAIVFTQWNFNNDTLTPNIGTGTASLVGGTTGTFTSGTTDGGSSDGGRAWNTTTYPTQGTNNKTAGVQFSTGTQGFQNIIVSWDKRNSSSASRHTQFQYSIDGVNFIDFGTPFVANTGPVWINGNTVNLSSITGVNNNPNFAFRLVSAFTPSTSEYGGTASTYQTDGIWRFDAVTIQGDMIEPTPVPFDIPGGATIPTVGSLLALGVMRKVKKSLALKAYITPTVISDSQLGDQYSSNHK